MFALLARRTFYFAASICELRRVLRKRDQWIRGFVSRISSTASVCMCVWWWLTQCFTVSIADVKGLHVVLCLFVKLPEVSWTTQASTVQVFKAW